jgi:SsrA-binding protein
MSVLVVNKKARHEFKISKTLTAGIVLSGSEVKSLRLKHASLVGSFVKVIGKEVFLINAQINPYSFADTTDYEPKKTRKLLVKKKEIYDLLEVTSQKGWSIVPLKIFLLGKRIKLEIGIGKGKKEYEKRAVLKERTIKRETDRALKSKNF